MAKRNTVGPEFFRQVLSIGAGAGQTAWFNLGDKPMTNWALQVTPCDANGNALTGTGATWDVQLDGSLDGRVPTLLLEHKNGVQTEGETDWLSAGAPSEYALITWANVAVGTADHLEVMITGTPSVNLKG